MNYIKMKLVSIENQSSWFASLSASRRLFITFSPSLNLKFSLMKTHFKFVLQKDCLDDLSYAIMYETTKLAYRVSEDDVTRACNQVSTIAPILRLCLFMPFLYFLSFCGRQGCFPCSYVFLNCDEKIRPT